MQVDFSVAVTCLYFLLTSFTPVRLASSITITRQTKGTITVNENEPFTLDCTATESNKNKDISGSFEWKQGSKPVGKNDATINETRSKNNKRIQSILTVKKTPPKFGVTFYYSCTFGDTNKQIAVFIIPAGAIPNVTIVNGTNSPVQSIEAEYGETVELICSVSYKISESIKGITTFVMKWENENGRILKKDNPPLTSNDKLESFLFKHTMVVNSYRDGGIYSCILDSVFKSRFINLTSSIELKIKAQNNGAKEKEVLKYVGDDVQLQCDIVGYPIQYEWRDEYDNKLTDKSNSRYLVKGATLDIKDITYDDRKKYICLGNYNNKTQILKQTIILRVKDPLAPLWPFIGIIVEAIVVAAIIWGSEVYRSKRKTETDGGNKLIDDEPASTTCT